MKMRARAIGAILRKDLTTAWPGVAAILFIAIVQAVILGTHDLDSSGVHYTASVQIGFVAAALLAMCVIVFTGQQDPAAGTRHEWLTRPIGRLEMFLAKSLFFLTGVGLPILIGFILHDLLLGHSALEIAQTRAGAAVLILLGAPAAAALSALNDSLAGALILLSATLVVGVTTVFLISQPVGQEFAPTQMQWMFGALCVPVLFAGGLTLAFIGFGRRRVGLGRALAAAAPAPLVIIQAVFANYAVAGPAHANAIPAAPQEVVRIRPGSQRWCIEREARQAYEVVRQGFEGLTRGEALILDRSVRVGTGRSPVLVWNPADGRTIAFHRTDGAIEEFSLRTGAPLHFGPARSAESGASPLWRYALDLTLARQAGQYPIPTDGVRRRIPGLGYCRAGAPTIGRRRELGLELGLVAVSCFIPGDQPDLVAISTGAEPSCAVSCTVNYAPAAAEFPGGRTYRTTARWAGRLPSHVTVTTYDATARFSREVPGAFPPGRKLEPCTAAAA